MRALPLLYQYELYYSELSLLEALWKISKKLASLSVDEKGGEALSRVWEGLEAITTGMRHAPVAGSAAGRALELYLLGHRDMVDNLLYATVAEHGLLFLTVDGEFLGFLESRQLPAGNVVTPEKLQG